MAHNNFTPISYGSLASTDNVNRPLEQLSDAIDLVRTTAAADVAQAEADIEAAVAQVNADYIKMPAFALWTTTQVLIDDYYEIYLSDNPYYKETFVDGDTLLIRVGDTVVKEASKPVKIYDKDKENVVYTGYFLGTSAAAKNARLLYRYNGTNWVFVCIVDGGNSEAAIIALQSSKMSLPMYGTCANSASSTHVVHLDMTSATTQNSINTNAAIIVKYTYAQNAGTAWFDIYYNNVSIKTARCTNLPVISDGDVVLYHYDGTYIRYIAKLN